jgi:hypothetical protein
VRDGRLLRHLEDAAERQVELARAVELPRAPPSPVTWRSASAALARGALAASGSSLSWSMPCLSRASSASVADSRRFSPASARFTASASAK